MDTLKINNFGPITHADIEFGDLTLLVGRQATGKSILLQLIKLIADKKNIIKVLTSYGYVWQDTADFLGLFFGEGMSGIWNEGSRVVVDGHQIDKTSFLDVVTDRADEDEVFYIPAQRVLALQNGWPKPFSDFGSDPYVLKAFSESLRSFMEIGKGRLLFPGNENKRARDHMYQSVYYDGEVEIDITGNRKRFTLNIEGNKLPYMAWSAGQKEFMPLWLGMGILFYPSNLSNASKKVVIIEEPEMGLHPNAIEHIIVQVLELMGEGYKVIMSTHSPIFLEFSWAIKLLKDNNASLGTMIELLGSNDGSIRIKDALNIALRHKTFKTYYFDRVDNKVTVKNISSLDASSEDPVIAEWGGLSSFASRASEIVAKNIAL